MKNYADKNYFHAKLMALHSSFIKKSQYSELINSGKIEIAFPELSREKTSNYIEIKEIAFRKQIEKIITLIESSKHYKKLFQSFLSIYEINNIKLILLNAYDRRIELKQWNDISPYNIVEIKQLEQKISSVELKSIFQGTFLHNAFLFETLPPYEILEKKIEFLVVENILNFSKNLLTQDKKNFNEIMLWKIISNKITWQYRLENFYKLNKDDVNNELSCFDELFNSQKDMKIRAANIENKLRENINNKFPIITNISKIENYLDKQFLLHLIKRYNKNFHSINPVLSYLWMLHYQIKNIFSIIEGFRFRVSPEILFSQIICGD